MIPTRFSRARVTLGRLVLLAVAGAQIASSQLAAQDTEPAASVQRAAATPAKASDALFPRWQVGSSMFMLANAFPESPKFAQLNVGYRVTDRDVVSLEAITWTYDRPLGIPWGRAKDDKLENYPGSVRSVGVGVAYQRFLWRGAYAAGHALPLMQQYRDPAGRELQKGFQLFTTLRVGYHVPLFRKRWFVEPSIAMTAWPVNTNLPDSFEVRERKWSKYFLGEPGLHFGMRF